MTQSLLESPVRTETDRRVGALLETIVRKPDLHVAWLETLSLLEFTGARKIAGSVLRPDREVLSHLAEEARHARFFAALADRVRGEMSPEAPAAPTVALEGRAGLLYFHRLDDGIARDVEMRLPPAQRRLAVYYHVTAAIEERALSMYQLYNQILRDLDTKLRLDGVIAEEEGHLDEMYARMAELDPEHGTARDRYAQLEAGLFLQFLGALEKTVAA